MNHRPQAIHLSTPDGERTVMPTADDAGRPLSVVLRRHGVPLNTRCAGRGVCESCRVTIADEGGDDGADSVRACQVAFDPARAWSLTVPARSLVADSPKVLDAFAIEVPLADQPIAAERYALAVDIGTTTVAVALVDLRERRIVGRASAFNHQLHLGDDVLTRINLCLTEPANIDALRRAVVEQTLRPLCDELMPRVEGGDRVGAVVVAGNTTMLHLLVGVDPSPMGIAPFSPAFIEHRELGIGVLFDEPPAWCARDAVVHLLPSAAAYVGADIVGGCVVTGMPWGESTALFVDVGTNGEIVLRHGGELIGCATAAGPAFEGQGLRSGVRATRGAISGVAFDLEARTINCETIGGDKPIGLCGSAYIDVLARGRALGLLQPNGRFTERCAEVFADRLERGAYGGELRLAGGVGGEPIVIAEADIALLLQAKGAIGAGITTLLKHAGIAPADVDRLHLAGGFGMHLNPAHAIACGMVPGFAEAQVQRVGNTALGAAFAACLDRSIITECRRAAERIDVLELNLSPGFEDVYIDHLRL